MPVIRKYLEDIKDVAKKSLKGNEIVLLGNGPSLWKTHPAALGKHNVLGINQSWKWMRADYHCCLDPEHVRDYRDRRYTTDCLITNTEHLGILYDYPYTVLGVDMYPKIPFGWQNTWKNNVFLGGFPLLTGLFAIQLAIWMGAKVIWLVGFDSSPSRVGQHKWYNHAAKQLESVEVEIYNTNPKTHIEAFPIKERKDWLYGQANTRPSFQQQDV